MGDLLEINSRRFFLLIQWQMEKSNKTSRQKFSFVNIKLLKWWKKIFMVEKKCFVRDKKLTSGLARRKKNGRGCWVEKTNEKKKANTKHGYKVFGGSSYLRSLLDFVNSNYYCNKPSTEEYSWSSFTWSFLPKMQVITLEKLWTNQNYMYIKLA